MSLTKGIPIIGRFTQSPRKILYNRCLSTRNMPERGDSAGASTRSRLVEKRRDSCGRSLRNARVREIREISNVYHPLPQNGQMSLVRVITLLEPVSINFYSEGERKGERKEERRGRRKDCPRRLADVILFITPGHREHGGTCGQRGEARGCTGSRRIKRSDL